jgi:hypothetical protein
MSLRIRGYRCLSSMWETSERPRRHHTWALGTRDTRNGPRCLTQPPASLVERESHFNDQAAHNSYQRRHPSGERMFKVRACHVNGQEQSSRPATHVRDRPLTGMQYRVAREGRVSDDVQHPDYYPSSSIDWMTWGRNKNSKQGISKHM